MKKDVRKRQVMEAGLRLFAERGYHATSVADITRAVPVARGTFYRYFEDKHDLFARLLEENISFIKRVLPTVPANRRVTAEELERILRRGFEVLLSHPQARLFMNMMVREAAAADRLFAHKVEAFYDELAEILCGYISRFQEQGIIERRDPLISSYLLLGSLKEIFFQWAKEDKFDNLEQLSHEVIQFIVYGLKPIQKSLPG